MKAKRLEANLQKWGVLLLRRLPNTAKAIKEVGFLLLEQLTLVTIRLETLEAHFGL